MVGVARARVGPSRGHRREAAHAFAFSLFGEVFISEDAGDSWTRVPREFGEIRTAARLP
jgi:hypothetical protein